MHCSNMALAICKQNLVDIAERHLVRRIGNGFVKSLPCYIPLPWWVSPMKVILSDEVEIQLKEDFFGRSATGFFVEVGANDPRINSQTWHLEQLGWDGILVEPQPDLVERLQQQRRAKVYAAACSSPANSGKIVTLNLAGPHSSLEQGFVDPRICRVGTAAVSVRTLDDILTDAKAPTPLDFISIDVENHEIEVLEGFDLTIWRPRLILIEDHALNLRLHRYLTTRDYKWVRRTGLNGWYVPSDAPISVNLTGYMQFFRKHYLSVPFRQLRYAKRRVVNEVTKRWQGKKAT
jgi:FkbM family methyltransferase